MSVESLKKTGFQSDAATIVRLSMQEKPREFYDLEIEQSLLGCLIHDNLAFERICGKVDAHDFYAPIHQQIFAAIVGRIDRGERATAVSLSSEFFSHPDLKAMGGGNAYLADLACGMYLMSSVEDYASVIRTHAQRRKLLAAIQVAEGAIQSSEPLGAAIDEFQRALSDVADADQETILDADTAWEDTKRHIEDVMNGKVKLTSTGIKKLDRAICSFQPGNLYILAARPGVGKTALALNMAGHVCTQGDVFVVSLEMPASQLVQRIAARETGISVDKQQRGTLSTDEARALFSLKIPKSLRISDRSGKDIRRIVNECKKFVRQSKNPKLIIIDYIGLITGDPRMQKVHQIEEITNALKTMAKNLEIPVLALCQLSRSVEAREDKRPNLSDLRDSGSIEQDADVVMFIYREEMYLTGEPVKNWRERDTDYQEKVDAYHRQAQNAKGQAEIIIRKNRHGRQDTIDLRFDGGRQSFSEGSHG